jgi:hypothetical protein
MYVLGYYMEDTKVKKRVMVEPSTWWLRTKSSKKDKNAILSTNFAKASNFRLGIHENKVLKCISGCTFTDNSIQKPWVSGPFCRNPMKFLIWWGVSPG